MAQREKVLKLINIWRVLGQVRDEINAFRYPIGPKDGPPMLEVSKEEEEAIIEEFVKSYCEHFSCNTDDEFDAAIIFYESGIGQKILHPPREFLINLANITSRALLGKLQEYSRMMEINRAFDQTPSSKIVQ